MRTPPGQVFADGNGGRVIERLQRLCAYVFLVSAGTLAAALFLVRLSAWLGLPAGAPEGTGPMVRVVVGLVMALTGSAVGWVALAFLAGIAPGARRGAAWIGRRASGRSRGEIALWGGAALAALGLVAGLW